MMNHARPSRKSLVAVRMCVCVTQTRSVMCVRPRFPVYVNAREFSKAVFSRPLVSSKHPSTIEDHSWFVLASFLFRLELFAPRCPPFGCPWTIVHVYHFALLWTDVRQWSRDEDTIADRLDVNRFPSSGLRSWIEILRRNDLAANGTILEALWEANTVENWKRHAV